MTQVGDVIQPGQSIPEDVTGLDDADGRPWRGTGRGHWHTSEDAIEACIADECYEDSTWKMKRRMPLTVTAVREPEPQPESDLLDLVQRHGQAWHDVASGPFDDNVEGAEVGSRIATANALFARIEAEVQQLRAERDDLQKLFEMQYDRTAKAVEIWRAEAPEERAQVLLPDFGELVTWLLRRVGDQGREHLALSAEIDHYRNAARDLRVQLDAARAPQQDGPLVLSLPTVPDGAVALIGHTSGFRFTPRGSDEKWWSDETGLQSLASLLAVERSVTVVMREPRTWPKLDDGPSDVRVIRGASGQTWYRNVLISSCWQADNGARVDTFPGLQNLDGPLTEVFDDGGER